ncbi:MULTISPECIES: hypothetical protein [Brevibacterium]|uniref:hypothetical protein n=1 Tax=Brevibacterium TaxID=1696 RepID=UPI00111E1BB6
MAHPTIVSCVMFATRPRSAKAPTPTEEPHPTEAPHPHRGDRSVSGPVRCAPTILSRARVRVQFVTLTRS